MESLKVGHYTHSKDATGLSVFLFDYPVPAACHICGAAPATRELHILDLDFNTPEINGLVLTGGSAYGLGAVDGVMNYLNEKGSGKFMPHGGVVPLIPGAAIYDLALGTARAPTAENAYEACLAAEARNFAMGRIGAGTGATVGKLIPNTLRMSGGLGYAQNALANGIVVCAYAVVNAVGDVLDERGQIIAGACLTNGEFVNSEDFLLAGREEQYASPSNTTLIAIFTNAKFSKIELKRIAKMAVSGMARALSPIFTRYDGDIIFSVSLGSHLATELTIGAMAVDVTQKAIINAVKNSIPIKV